MLILNIIILGILAIGIVQCLNPSDVTEGPCFATSAASNIDANWIIGKYDFTPIGPGVIEFSAEPPVPGAGERFISTITLTDNKTFAFLTKCFTGQNQRGWDLFTINPQIVTPQFQKQIEDYAVSLGFNREEFAFLRHDYCKHLFGQGIGYGWR